MANNQTFRIQYYGEDRRWHFAKNGDHRIEVSSRRAAMKEREIVESVYGRKARMLQTIVIERVVPHLTKRALDGAKPPRKSKRSTGSPRK